ncbi:class I SAM-dependent RNA methyltransferase [Rhodobacteraceae bacterium N5(2021)]|uniref:Class I SAM-dependent RNA methyltransferase n=1 Tax=Gymnodinialimonas phycosphaerae TaxID=2841589 RepID=A0A975TU09_9RHOB|nr:class I SAM-dependent RNA methyltransferase [Gymnodinialimonas phycosphaerae]MBY4894170.1 class I SAM-dependent RNA methyltransferase [Gymnodinialimonas phycosphaerae]
MTQLTITRLGHHGDGIASDTTGRPIFVPRTLPGEVISGEVDGDRIAAPSVITPSPNRVKAPCPHYKSCGGCSLMHASDDFVAAWKTSVITTALQAHDLPTPLRPIVTSAPRSRRRATLAGTRTKKGAMIGFHARKSGTIVPIRDCFLLEPALLDTIPALEQIVKIGASRSATLGLSVTLTETGIDLHVTGAKPLDGPLRAALPQVQGSFSRLTWSNSEGDEPVYTETPPRLTLGTARVVPPPGTFLQATRDGEAALQAAVAEATQGAKHIADLFCGIGTFALPLAQTTPVHAVEAAPDMIDALDHATRFATGLKPITMEKRDLFRRPLLPDELSKFDAVVIDPPRAGAEAQTIELAKAQVPVIAAVSCNPVTFARDAAVLTNAGYTLDWVQPVDQFRWSPHVELAARFSLAHING